MRETRDLKNQWGLETEEGTQWDLQVYVSGIWKKVGTTPRTENAEREKCLQIVLVALPSSLNCFPISVG